MEEDYKSKDYSHLNKTISSDEEDSNKKIDARSNARSKWAEDNVINVKGDSTEAFETLRGRYKVERGITKYEKQQLLKKKKGKK